MTLTKQKKQAEDTIAELKRTHDDDMTSLQAELQHARFEMNSLKDQITGSGEFAQISETVQKLQQMIYMKHEKEFSEREITAFK